MRKSIFLILIFFTTYLYSQQAISLDEVRKAGLYVVEIETINNEEPEGLIITKPGTEGENMTYKNKVPCRIVISLDENILYDSGPYLKNTSGAIIRITGNTSAYFSDPLNMPYRIKLETASDLLCRGNNDVYKDKN